MNPKDDKLFQDFLKGVISQAQAATEPQMKGMISSYEASHTLAGAVLDYGDLDDVRKFRLEFFRVCAIPGLFDNNHRRMVLERLRNACTTPTGQAVLRANPGLFNILDEAMIKLFADFKRANPDLWNPDMYREKPHA